MKQQDLILLKLREMILNGVIAPGERLTELGLCERLSISRTPVRYALNVLSEEGLLEAAGGRGFRVRAFSLHDIALAIDVRAVLEGLAARQCAEHGMSTDDIARLRKIVDETEHLFQDDGFHTEHIVQYSTLNGAFHEVIVRGSGNVPLQLALARNDKLPFAAANAFAFNKTRPESEMRRLAFAHMQHQQILEALIQRDAARAETLMREHAYNAKTSILNMNESFYAPDDKRAAAKPL